TPRSAGSAPGSAGRRVRGSRSLVLRLRHGMHGCVEQVRIGEFGLVPRRLALDRLQPRRERLVPFPGQGGHVTEDARQLIHTDVPRKGKRVETGAAYGGGGQDWIRIGGGVR